MEQQPPAPLEASIHGAATSCSSGGLYTRSSNLLLLWRPLYVEQQPPALLQASTWSSRSLEQRRAALTSPIAGQSLLCSAGAPVNAGR